MHRPQKPVRASRLDNSPPLLADSSGFRRTPERNPPMRTAIARALILPVLLAIPLVSGCQSEAKKHLYKAEDLFEKRDLDGAKKELEISIKLDDTSLDAHNSLAHIDEALGDQEGAAREYEKASELDPPDQKLLQNARLYKQLEDLPKYSRQALHQT